MGTITFRSFEASKVHGAEMSVLQTAIEKLRQKINSPMVRVSGYSSELEMVAAAMKETDDRLQSLEHKYAELLKKVSHVTQE